MSNEYIKKKIVHALINTRLTGNILCVFKTLYHTAYRWVSYHDLNLAVGFPSGAGQYNTGIAQVIGGCGLWNSVVQGNEHKLSKQLFLHEKEPVRSKKSFQLTPEFRACIDSCNKLLDILELPGEQLRKEFPQSKLLGLYEEDFSSPLDLYFNNIPKEIAPAVVKKAIELRAMEVVASYYTERGWSVEDTSMSNPEGSGAPFDFLITKGVEKKYVEVKGTSTNSGHVTLTANEVLHATQHSSQSVLVVVSGIKTPIIDGYVQGVDGQITYHVDPWCPEQSRLTCTQFRYDIS
jgi:hypothetical protein